MNAPLLTGGFADPARDSARAFRAVLEATARPGTIQTVAGHAAPGLSPAASTLLLALTDQTTPLHLAGPLDTDDLRGWIAFHTGAPLAAAPDAAFALGRWADLHPVTRFRIGDPSYPDRSATLIVECDRLANDGPRLTGPGIRDSARLSLPETAAFRANRALFPLGFDTILTCGDRLAALPRTTIVEDN
ncbi:Alpha-D-ribose 1-methylphosphonate 5-triphosphate synthase subunit PhnH [Paracoccus haematequi]|uniref:Alpha-D-ribose 1-methylphosphonate 5-triphosphate synthase subunit PhnH n=1 Tax=Paracoccus haematequi TaxID=2491866 RepID=A0A3S4CYS9_9RHOB|nr:phosphonate C-P lyase system protein PhnH [Paracoccus haematequi]VDS08699.1 Alpha-D-ribose 1-methylphosphonate 5-triphosphate synthase subunit PhnH [Paracoccus haematequi]